LVFNLEPLLASGNRSSSALIKAAGISRPTLMRAVRGLGDQVLTLGRARATRYALRETLPGLSTSEFPAFSVDEQGEISQSNTLITLAGTESVWLPDESVIDGLPVEIHDVAPRGFLGRSFARRNQDLGLPEDVMDWSDHHVLAAVTRRGEDLPGNFVIGKESFERWQELWHDETGVEQFPALAEAALAGEHTGSSAGGERPKFTCLHQGEHCIVKFSNARTENARRWQDLLRLEHLALETLRDHSISAARSELVDYQNWRFLIVYRFDRIGARGRVPTISLAAASGMEGRPWMDAAHTLSRNELLSDEHVRQIALLDAFGAQIANNDRHLHNVCVFPRDDRYDLAPAFDQLPMAYAPQASGNMLEQPVKVARPSAETLHVWGEANSMARAYWRAAVDAELTDTMHTIAAEHAQR
jgi:hypothetical protein